MAGPPKGSQEGAKGGGLKKRKKDNWETYVRSVDGAKRGARKGLGWHCGTNNKTRAQEPS